MRRMNKDSFLRGRKFSGVSMDENRRYIIHSEYKEFWVPISGIKEIISSEEDYGEIGEVLEGRIPPLFTVGKSSPLTPADVKTLGIISDLERLIKDLKENFDDIRARQIFFFEFKERINELWNISKGDMKKAALRLEYAIKNLKSERLNENQIDALAEAIEVLEESGGKGKEEIKKILLDVGIFTVPKIEGLAELYADEY